MAEKRINGQEYAWGDITFVALGRTIGGAIGVEYKPKKEKKALHASGRNPRAIQHGKREYEGTLTVLQSELIALNRAARQMGYKDALDIEFDLIVSYISPGGIVTTDRIVKLSITELPTGMKEGDMNSEHALPFVALDINYDI